jgi:hypothetical protein
MIRVQKDRLHPYVMVSRALAEDEFLSLEARGLMLYLLAKPDNWTVMFKDLQRAGSMGEDRTRRILKELEGAGYLHRRRINAGGGRFRWESIICETPSAGLPGMVEPGMAEPYAAERQIQQVGSEQVTIGANKEREGALPLNEALPHPLIPDALADPEAAARYVEAGARIIRQAARR